MGKVRTKVKAGRMKRMINPRDSRLKPTERLKKSRKKNRVVGPTGRKGTSNIVSRSVPNMPTALFFQYNANLGPPYHVLVDTNFINFSIKNKLDICQGMMDCLYAKCIPCVTDCVVAELEKLGSKFRIALKIIKDPRITRLSCIHKGTYADDCIFQRVSQHKCYIVATCDKELKQRIRKIPGVPIMYIHQHRYSVERMPDAFGAPRT